MHLVAKADQTIFQPSISITLDLPRLPATLSGINTISVGNIVQDDLPKTFNFDITINTFPDEFSTQKLQLHADSSATVQALPKVRTERSLTIIPCSLEIPQRPLGRFKITVPIEYEALNIGQISVDANVVSEWTLNGASTVSALVLPSKIYPEIFTLQNERRKQFKIKDISYDSPLFDFEVLSENRVHLTSKNLPDNAIAEDQILIISVVNEQNELRELKFPIAFKLPGH